MAHNDLSGSTFQYEKSTPLTMVHREKSTNNQNGDTNTNFQRASQLIPKSKINSQNIPSNLLVIYIAR